MKSLLIVYVAIFFVCASADDSMTLNCSHLKMDLIVKVLNYFTNKITFNIAQFYLQYVPDIINPDTIEEIEIGVNNKTVFNSGYFNFSRKTAFIIHGFQSSHKEQQIAELAKELVKSNRVNVILVDWSRQSKTWNYFHAVKTTYLVAQDVVKFLKDMKNELLRLGYPVSNKWRKLYLIGHSLGAHISGQIGYLVQQNFTKTFKVKRITGLDPAKPCFVNVPLKDMLDSTDADFVDVIHTQTDHGSMIMSSLGYKNPLGHVDFYINGGAMQPACDNMLYIQSLEKEQQKMICSHGLAIRLMIESLRHEKSRSCRFIGHKWYGDSKEAFRILFDQLNGHSCSDCVEMGINAVKYKNYTGTYLVILSSKQPFCEFKQDDESKLKSAITLL